eukprot:m.715759 g.715759  ORF g.715759 m.715759 type:complete len:85 (+) comp22980_c1_seq16:3170-3424(+)
MVRQFFTNGERDERGTRGPVVTASGATTTVLFEAMRFRNAIDTFQYASPVQCGAAVVVSASKGASVSSRYQNVCLSFERYICIL